MKTLLIYLTLAGSICLISSFTLSPKNAFKIGSKEWSLTSSIIANESYGINSKFEIDLVSNHEAMPEAKTWIWLSLTNNTTTKLSEGVYQFSAKGIAERSPFQFNGAIKINGQEVKITEGTFSIEMQKENTDIHFILKLENGDLATGSYSGKFSEIDRSSNYK